MEATKKIELVEILNKPLLAEVKLKGVVSSTPKVGIELGSSRIIFTPIYTHKPHNDPAWWILASPHEGTRKPAYFPAALSVGNEVEIKGDLILRVMLNPDTVDAPLLIKSIDCLDGLKAEAGSLIESLSFHPMVKANIRSVKSTGKKNSRLIEEWKAIPKNQLLFIQ